MIDHRNYLLMKKRNIMTGNPAPRQKKKNILKGGLQTSNKRIRTKNE